MGHNTYITYRRPGANFSEIDPALPVSLAALTCLWWLQAVIEPIGVVFTYLLLVMPACSAYLLSGMTGEYSLYKDLRSLCMLFAMGTVVLVVSEL